MRLPTLFVATFKVNDGNTETMNGPNAAKMSAELHKIIREKAGDDGSGQYEIRKIYTDKERQKHSIPDSIHGQIIETATFINGKKWVVEKPFKKYF